MSVKNTDPKFGDDSVIDALVKPESAQEMFERFDGDGDCEMTNRLIPGGGEFEYPEWAEYGELDDGAKVVCYYRTTPEDQEMVDMTSDWGGVDWWKRVDRFEELDENGVPFRVIAE